MNAPSNIPVDIPPELEEVAGEWLTRVRELGSDIEPDERDPVNGSDAVFAAVAAAVWLHQGCPPDWPTAKGVVL